jgi:hypothetical protein
MNTGTYRQYPAWCGHLAGTGITMRSEMYEDGPRPETQLYNMRLSRVPLVPPNGEFPRFLMV